MRQTDAGQRTSSSAPSSSLFTAGKWVRRKAPHCHTSSRISPNSTERAKTANHQELMLVWFNLRNVQEGHLNTHCWGDLCGQAVQESKQRMDTDPWAPREGGTKVELRQSQSSADACFPSAVHGLQSPSFLLCLTLCLCVILSMQSIYYSINSPRELCYLRAWEGRK